MGYKRLARIVFLSGLHAAPANLAAHYGNRFGARWVVAQAAVLPGVCGDVPAFSSAQLEWADLLVTLDAVALAAKPLLPAGIQHRHYAFEPIPAASDKIAWREFALRLRERVEGMIGGMRMLEHDAQADDEL
ncbi:MAG: hypothetical protein ACYCSS_14135 [Sulfuriferula sp.]